MEIRVSRLTFLFLRWEGRSRLEPGASKEEDLAGQGVEDLEDSVLRLLRELMQDLITPEPTPSQWCLVIELLCDVPSASGPEDEDASGFVADELLHNKSSVEEASMEKGLIWVK